LLCLLTCLPNDALGYIKDVLATLNVGLFFSSKTFLFFNSPLHFLPQTKKAVVEVE
jgi:hypothetical protein